MKNFKAGASSIDISPEKGIALCGYPNYERINIGVHDPLYASCIYINDGDKELVMVTADLVFFEKPYVKDLRFNIEKETGISSANIMLSCTHTHSGPFTRIKVAKEEIQFGWFSFAYPSYLEELKKKIVKVCCQAKDNAKFAKIGVGKGICGKEKGIGGNRDDKDGITDPSVGVIGIKDMEDKWIAIWVRYSLHPTLLQFDNMLVSADYPGYIRQYFKTEKPEAVFLFAQGATGDQSSRYFRKGETFDEAKRFGYAIAEEADKVISQIVFSGEAVFSNKSVDIIPPIKNLDTVSNAEKRLNDLRNKWSKLIKDNANYKEIQTCYLDRLGAEYDLYHSKCKEEKRPFLWVETEFPFEIQVIRLGDAYIVGIPGEIYVKYTLDIEKKSVSKNTFPITLTNGLGAGYIVTREVAQRRIFEAGVSLLKPESGDLIVNIATDIIKELNG
jgi:hypothetical protein